MSGRQACRFVKFTICVLPVAISVRVTLISTGSRVILPGLLTPTFSTKSAEAAVTGNWPADRVMDSVEELATRSGSGGA